MGEKNGNSAPVLANASAIVLDIPELFAINAKPTTEVTVIIGYFNWSNVDINTLKPFFKLMPISGKAMKAATSTALPGLERILNSKGFITTTLPVGLSIAP